MKIDNQKMTYRECEDRLEGMTMESPCNNCPEKQLYARMFDMHFSGADCPYECEKYERYLRSSKEDAYAASAGCTDGGADVSFDLTHGPNNRLCIVGKKDGDKGAITIVNAFEGNRPRIFSNC